MTRLCATLLVLGWSATALAQDAVWATEDIESTRFFDAEVAGPEIAKGTRLTGVMRGGERGRGDRARDIGIAVRDDRGGR